MQLYLQYIFTSDTLGTSQSAKRNLERKQPKVLSKMFCENYHATAMPKQKFEDDKKGK